MEDLKKSYSDLIFKRHEVLNEIKQLKEDEKVKRYLELLVLDNDLANNQNELYKKIKMQEYTSCNHIWVDTLGVHNLYRTCIKCGLDRRVLYYVWRYHKVEYLTKNEKIMYEFIKSNSDYYKKGFYTNVSCDADLAFAICRKIKEVHPDIDDTTLIKYFEIALDNIRNNNDSKERKESRAKRLELKPNFNKWNKSDIDKC